jgi:signal transduction histidine kinase
MRKLNWRAFLRIIRPNYNLPESARVINRRWLHRQAFVLSLGSTVLTLLCFPLFHILTTQPGESALDGKIHRIAVIAVAGLCLVLPLVFQKLRQHIELFTLVNLLAFFLCVAVDSSLSERIRRYTALGLIPLFASTFIFTNLRYMTVTYSISGIFFVALNHLRDRPGEVTSLYAIAHVTAWFMAVIRIRSLHRMSYDQARLYERRVYDQRVRLARDIHDSLGGDLMQLVFQITGRTPRHQMLNLAHVVLAKTKNLVYALDPLSENRYFPDFARSYVERLRETGRLRVELDIAAEWAEMRFDHALNLRAIFTEWMTNTMRYSRAKRVRVVLRRRDNVYFLVVVDNGTGFRWTGNKQGSGLRNIAVRADLMNARVFARKTRRRGGTIFFLRGKFAHD